jgi:hypothetical protein
MPPSPRAGDRRHPVRRQAAGELAQRNSTEDAGRALAALGAVLR